MADLVDDLLWLQLLFEIGRLIGALAADKVIDLGERKSELLAPEDHLHANAIDSTVVARVALAPRLDQPAIFIEAQRAQAHSVKSRHLADGQFRLLRPGRRFGVVFRVARGCAGCMIEGRHPAHDISFRRRRCVRALLIRAPLRDSSPICPTGIRLQPKVVSIPYTTLRIIANHTGPPHRRLNRFFTTPIESSRRGAVAGAVNCRRQWRLKV